MVICVHPQLHKQCRFIWDGLIVINDETQSSILDGFSAIARAAMYSSLTQLSV